MRTLVVAPHPDDEILGVGGTLLRRKSEGAELGWLIMTSMSKKHGWEVNSIAERQEEISEIKEKVGFQFVQQLNFATSRLDEVPRQQLVMEVSNAIKLFEPREIYLPHYSDVHSDHKITHQIVASAIKWFRNDTPRRVLAYETLSETGFGFEFYNTFIPNVYINIEAYLSKKIELFSVYKSEIDISPFPRSVEMITALARLRGSFSGFKAAEAFQLLREYE